MAYNSKSFRAPSRRGALVMAAGLAALPLAACGGGGGADGSETGLRADNVLGDPDAPVTVIEYASITCPHCKAFHDQVFGDLRARYIDTGKVRFVFRELPTSPAALAMAGFLLARCAPEDKYFDVLDLLFEKQIPLVQAYQSGGSAARDELVRIARAMGVSEEQFDVCIRDQAEIDRIQKIGDDGYAQFSVNSTPAFVINGRTYGAMTIDEFAAIIDPLLPAES
jgi:protein-disulfide isomerase